MVRIQLFSILYLLSRLKIKTIRKKFRGYRITRNNFSLSKFGTKLLFSKKLNPRKFNSSASRELLHNIFNSKFLIIPKLSVIESGGLGAPLSKHLNFLRKSHKSLIHGHVTFTKGLVFYLFKLKGLLYNINLWYKQDDFLILNYKKRNFFPNISCTGGKNLVTTSLGLFAKMFLKGKSFIRNKAVYLVTALFLRKVLLYSSFRGLTLFVKRQPLYFQEIINTLFKPVISTYKHPFNGSVIDEKFVSNQYYFNNIIFGLSKNYTYNKTRRRGRLKRRIMKRLVKVNNILD